MLHTVSREIAGRTLTLETGKLAGQANGAVVVRYGDSVVLATAGASPKPREGADFFPLTVDFEERLYAVGKIPGSFFRREGRPTTDAVLVCRMTDRPLRPLFPSGFRNEVQVIVTALSADQENPLDILAIIGASAALSISDIPFDGPVGATRLGYLDEEFRLNPTYREIKEGSLDLVVAGTMDAVVMVEAGINELTEETVLEAIRRSQENNQRIIEMQRELVALAGKPKMAFRPADDPAAVAAAEQAITQALGGRLLATVFSGREKGEREDVLAELRQEVRERLGETVAAGVFSSAWEIVEKRQVRTKVLAERRRPDGRGPSDIRPITCETGVLPRAHGSGLFTRGQTQVMTIATLASLGQRQNLDGISPEESRRYLHHYNFPPYSVGEVRRLVGPGRREIGHGALAERALLPVIPNEEEFPYTIRLVSEVMSSNGSTSMASICGSVLALMDAGVPIVAPVAGVAMGLIMGEGGDYMVLTDIQGMEDHLGDMDFKVAGTAQGISALQMDIKVKGITYDVMAEALAQARQARLVVLEKMRQAIDRPKAELSPYAPRMIRIKIPVEKIGSVIGPGGKTIRALIERTKTTIDVENDGSVTIGSSDAAMAQEAVEAIQLLTREVEVGAIYTGTVTRIMPFGAFVEILPGKDGLVHISELADYRVPSVEDVVQIGDEVMVKVLEIDHMGRVNLSRRAVYATQGEEPGSGPRDDREPRQERPFRAPVGGDARDRGRSGPPGRGYRDRGPGGPQGQRGGRPPGGPRR